MDKQKKIVLQVIPVIILALIFLFVLIFKSFRTESSLETGIINTDIPDVNKKIEENKMKAYENKKIYDQPSVEISDLKLITGIITDSIPTKDGKDKGSSKSDNLKNESKPTHYKNVKKQFRDEIQNTKAEYKNLTQQQTKPASPEANNNQAPTVRFNTFTRKATRKEHNKLQIYASIHGEQTVYNRSLVKLRVTEPFTYKNKLVPVNTFVFGQCNFSSNGRVMVSIRSIPFIDYPITCHATIYDLDGFEGINIFHSIENNAGKKNAASASRKIGNTFSTTLKTVTGQSLAGELAGTATENVIKGITDGVNEKIKLEKAILSNNYRVIIKFEK